MPGAVTSHVSEQYSVQGSTSQKVLMFSYGYRRITDINAMLLHVHRDAVQATCMHKPHPHQLTLPNSANRWFSSSLVLRLKMPDGFFGGLPAKLPTSSFISLTKSFFLLSAVNVSG